MDYCEEEDESVRLVEDLGEGESSEGMVQICVGVYVPVCGGTFWDERAAEVVCQQLGFEGTLLPHSTISCFLHNKFDTVHVCLPTVHVRVHLQCTCMCV